jgi:hypothetical protein
VEQVEGDRRELVSMRSSGVRRIWVAALASFVLAFGVVGCGDSNDDKSDGESTAAQVATTPEQKVKQSYLEFVDAMESGDIKRACAAFTPAERARFGRGVKGGCVQALGLGGVGVGAQEKRDKVKFLQLKVNGDKAVSRLRTGDDGRVFKIKFAKINGEWKVDGDEE